MHFLCGLEGLASIGYKHRGPICPITQHIFITNINWVDHKLIRWWEKDESPTSRGTPIEDLDKELHDYKKIAKIKDWL
jgi:hypothetical protein